MELAQFEAMVARLEAQSARSPGGYQLRVAMLALVGFAILALIVGIAGAGLLLLTGILVAALLTGGKAIILILKLGKLLLLLAIPMWVLVKSSLSALFTRLPAPVGVELQRAQAPALFAAMDDMRRRMKGPRFHHVLVVNEVNAAVVQRPLFGLFGLPRNYLLLGLPLLESLSSDEALAVVAHEYGHLAGSHSRFAAFIYRLRHTWGTIQQLSGQWQGWGGRLLQRVVGWYAPYFNAYTFVLARANEYQADAASAELVGAPVAASALKRVNVASAYYEHFVGQTVRTLRDVADPPPDLAARWAAAAAAAMPAEQAHRWLKGALDRESGLADTHPALADRLKALVRQNQVSDDLPAPLAQTSAAQAWLGAGLALLRERLGRDWHDRVAPSWSERHQEMQAQLKRLAELRVLGEPTPAERMEALHLQSQLYPEDDLVPALAEFNARNADHPQGLFMEGSARLHQGDEAGLALLEQAMALDADAVKPACELAWAFLSERKDERAQAFGERWNERNQWEAQRAAQLHTLDVTHELKRADLKPEELDKVQALLRSHGTGIVRAWLVLRELPVDPELTTYVLGIELTLGARLLHRGPRMVSRLSECEWPIHTFITAFDGPAKPLRKKMLAVADARILFGT